MEKLKKGDFIVITELHLMYDYHDIVGKLAQIKDIDNDPDGFNYWIDIEGYSAKRTRDLGFAWVKGVPATSLLKELV
jgi:hypothetical protein